MTEQRIDQIEVVIKELVLELTALRGDLNSFRNDLIAFKGTVDVSDVKRSNLKDDLATVKDNVKEIHQDLKVVSAAIGDIRTTIAGLQVKSGVWGMLGGLIPVTLGVFYILFKGLV